MGSAIVAAVEVLEVGIEEDGVVDEEAEVVSRHHMGPQTKF